MVKAITNYYLRLLVNPNNKQDIVGAQIRESFDWLRERLLEQFGWKDKGYIVFLPNAYYAKKLLLNYFLNDTPYGKDIVFFSDMKIRDEQVFKEEGIPVSFIDSYMDVRVKGQGRRWVYFTSGFEDIFPREQQEGQYLVGEVYYDEPEDIDHCDAFIFNVLDGVAVLGFKKEMDIKPLILGADSVVYADEEGYELKDDYRRLEAGTMDVPAILSVFEFYRSKIKRDHA